MEGALFRGYNLHMRKNLLAFLLASLALPAIAQESSEGGAAQGSFTPPIFSQATDAKYLFASAFLARASPLDIFGVVLGSGGSVYENKYPFLGYELVLDAARGGGTFADMLPEDFGGPDLVIGVTRIGGAGVLKAKPVDARHNGYFGLLFYGRAALDYTRIATKTGFGTAGLGLFGTTLNIGALLEGRIGEHAEVMLFGGYRSTATKPLADDMARTTSGAPEYGGNIAVHLPHNLTLTLSTLFGILRQGDDDEDLKVYSLGILWTPEGGVAPVVDGGAP